MAERTQVNAVPSPEIELALLLSNPLIGPSEAARVCQLGSGLLEWNQVFGMLVMHRTLGLAWRNIVEHDLGRPADFRPEYVLPVLEVFAKGQSLLAREHAAASSRIAQALERGGVQNVVLKGPTLAALGYGSVDLRISNDTDVLVHRCDLTRAHRIITGLGYVQGVWDVSKATVNPVSREEIVKHTLYSHETFPYVLPAPDAQMMDKHQVDMHFSVDIDTPSDSDDAVRQMLSRRIAMEPAPGCPMWSVSAEDMLIFVSVNFAQEARLRTETEELVDLVLYKVVDVLALLNSSNYPLNTEVLLSRVAEFGVAREVYFALHHVAALFPVHAPLALLEELRPDSLDYIDEVQDFASPQHAPQAPWHSWKSPIIDRFFDTRRLLELTG